MNSRERVTAALMHQEPDHVPAYPLINGVNRIYTGADYPTWSTNAEVCAESYIKATDDLGLDVICTLIDLSLEAADFGQKIFYDENEAAHPDITDRLIKSIEDYDLVKPINPRETPRMKMHIDLCDRLVKARGEETPVVAFVFGPLGILSMLRGQAELYMDIYDGPDKMKAALDIITDVLVEYCDALMDTGVDAIMFDTLFASTSIMGEDMWMEFEGEFMRRLAKCVHDRGVLVMIHNCGEGIYFDVQIETMNPAAISFLHVPSECESFADAKEKYGKDITLIGCIPPTDLPQISTEQLETICKEQIDTFADGGGFILATGCEYPANLDLGHARTMIEMAKTYGCRSAKKATEETVA